MSTPTTSSGTSPAGLVDAGATSTGTVRPVAGGAPVLTLVAAMLGFFIVTLDAVIVNVALPDIRAELGGGITGLQWVVNGYTLAFAALLLSSGSLADRIGAKRAFGAGLVVFVFASVACGVAPTLEALVGFRVVQGAAAAAMMPASMALIGQAYPESRRRAGAVATWAMGGAIASSSGPVLGGLLTLASWRWIFLVNLPVGLLALILLGRTERSATHVAPFDLLGQLTAVTSMTALTFAAVEAGHAGFGSARVLVALTVVVLAGTGFVMAEGRVRHPMVPLDLFRTPAVNSSVVVGFAFMVGYYGMPFVMSLFLQDERGLSSLQTGVLFFPMMFIGLVLTPFMPRLTRRMGARPVIVGGLIVLAVGCAAVALAPTDLALPGYAVLMVLAGLAGPTVIPPTIAVLLEAVPGHRAGTASGVLNTSRQLGGALAVAVFGALLNSPDGLAAGVRTSLLAAAGIALAAALVAAHGLRHTATQPDP